VIRNNSSSNLWLPRCHFHGLGYNCRRQRNREFCSSPGTLAFRPDGTAMKLDDLLNDGEAQTEPSELTGGTRIILTEAFKYVREEFGGNSYPIVR
jgi:hypothetical protein